MPAWSRISPCCAPACVSPLKFLVSLCFATLRLHRRCLDCAVLFLIRRPRLLPPIPRRQRSCFNTATLAPLSYRWSPLFFSFVSSLPLQLTATTKLPLSSRPTLFCCCCCWFCRCWGCRCLVTPPWVCCLPALGTIIVPLPSLLRPSSVVSRRSPGSPSIASAFSSSRVAVVCHLSLVVAFPRACWKIYMLLGLLSYVLVRIFLEEEY